MLDFLIPEPDTAGRPGLRLQKGDVWVIQSVGESLAITDHLRRVAVKHRS